MPALFFGKWTKAEASLRDIRFSAHRTRLTGVGDRPGSWRRLEKRLQRGVQTGYGTAAAALCGNCPAHRTLFCCATGVSNILRPLHLHRQRILAAAGASTNDDSRSGLAKRIAFVQFAQVVVDAAAFTFQEALDRIGERRVRQPVR